MKSKLFLFIFIPSSFYFTLFYNQIMYPDFYSYKTSPFVDKKIKFLFFKHNKLYSHVTNDYRDCLSFFKTHGLCNCFAKENLKYVSTKKDLFANISKTTPYKIIRKENLKLCKKLLF
jgi:hypothetical protein